MTCSQLRVGFNASASVRDDTFDVTAITLSPDNTPGEVSAWLDVTVTLLHAECINVVLVSDVASIISDDVCYLGALPTCIGP